MATAISPTKILGEVNIKVDSTHQIIDEGGYHSDSHAVRCGPNMSGKRLDSCEPTNLIEKHRVGQRLKRRVILDK